MLEPGTSPARLFYTVRYVGQFFGTIAEVFHVVEVKGQFVPVIEFTGKVVERMDFAHVLAACIFTLLSVTGGRLSSATGICLPSAIVYVMARVEYTSVGETAFTAILGRFFQHNSGRLWGFWRSYWRIRLRYFARLIRPQSVLLSLFI